MKKVALLACLLALAMAASAQEMIDFTHLADTSIPKPIDVDGHGYAGLSWSGIDYVDALIYGDANGHPNTGPGFYTGPEVMVAFGGGPLCFPNYGAKVNDGSPTKDVCESSISVGPGTPKAVFQVKSASVADGWGTKEDFITVTAYNNGVQVGSSQRYYLSPNAQQLKFPNWGPITQLTIHPSPRGSFVMYTLELK